jgi:hypothetical protein
MEAWCAQAKCFIQSFLTRWVRGGAAAAEPLSFIATAFARQSSLGPSAVHLFYANLNATILRGLARLLMATSSSGEGIPASFRQANDDSLSVYQRGCFRW